MDTAKLSWADYEEQYGALFNPQCPDLEASLMGIPPPPDEWIVPRKVARHPPPIRRQPVSPVKERPNPFTILEQDAEPHAPPASPREYGHSSGPSSEPSPSDEVEPLSRTPSARTS